MSLAFGTRACRMHPRNTFFAKYDSVSEASRKSRNPYSNLIVVHRRVLAIAKLSALRPLRRSTPNDRVIFTTPGRQTSLTSGTGHLQRHLLLLRISLAPGDTSDPDGNAHREHGDFTKRNLASANTTHVSLPAASHCCFFLACHFRASRANQIQINLGELNAHSRLHARSSVPISVVRNTCMRTNLVRPLTSYFRRKRSRSHS